MSNDKLKSSACKVCLLEQKKAQTRMSVLLVIYKKNNSTNYIFTFAFLSAPTETNLIFTPRNLLINSR